MVYAKFLCKPIVNIERSSSHYMTINQHFPEPEVHFKYQIIMLNLTVLVLPNLVLLFESSLANSFIASNSFQIVCSPPWPIPVKIPPLWLWCMRGTWDYQLLQFLQSHNCFYISKSSNQLWLISLLEYQITACWQWKLPLQ